MSESHDQNPTLEEFREQIRRGIPEVLPPPPPELGVQIHLGPRQGQSLDTELDPLHP